MKNPPNGSYQKNDIVRFGPTRGTVLTTQGSNPVAPVQVLFVRTKEIMGFRLDGKFITHTTDIFDFISLEFVKRPRPSLFDKLKAKFKKKVKAVTEEPVEENKKEEETQQVEKSA